MNVSAFNNVISHLCDAVDQPSANTCANLCPAHVKSDRFFPDSTDHNPRWIVVKRVMQSCDDTSWQEASEFLCIKTTLVLREFGNKKKSPQNPGNTFSDALLVSRYQDFVTGAAKTKTTICAFFDTALRAVLINPLIHELIRDQRFWDVVCFNAPLPP